MNGLETQDEKDRCAIWDAIFRGGPADATMLGEIVGMQARKVQRLVQHEWFKVLNAFVYIATVDGHQRESFRAA